MTKGSAATITWTGGDPSRDTVVLAGVSTDQAHNYSGVFVCAADPSAGQFAIPAEALAHMPATVSGLFQIGGWIGVGTIPTKASVETTAGGLDALLGAFQNWDLRVVQVHEVQP